MSIIVLQTHNQTIETAPGLNLCEVQGNLGNSGNSPCACVCFDIVSTLYIEIFSNYVDLAVLINCSNYDYVQLYNIHV